MSRLLGPARAKELIFTGGIVNGLEAQALGLVNHAVEQNDEGDAAYHRAVQLAELIRPNVRTDLECGRYHRAVLTSSMVDVTEQY